MKKIAIEVRCPFCGHVSIIGVNEEDYITWSSDELAQNCFPYLDASEREILISGLCLKCQDEVFGSDDDEDEDYEPANIDDDCGFDPYLGCFTDDC
jgi:hypothetical protein